MRVESEVRSQKSDVRGQTSEVRRQTSEDRRQRTKKLFSVFCPLSSVLCLLSSVFCLLSLAGCSPTYTKANFKESLIRICNKEYKLDAKVETVGRTVAVYLPVTDLWNYTFGLTESAIKKINDISTAAMRVSISSDASYDFYVIIAHDMRIPELQLIAIRYVDDVKRTLLSDISRGEAQKRMLIDRKINPQSQKEYAIKDVFEKMHLDKNLQETVMNDFFRAEPATLGDVGYWNGRFYVKDISLAEFLAEQIANRIAYEVGTDKKLSEIMTIKAMKGSYVSRPGGRFFQIEFLPERKWLKESETVDIGREVFQKALEVSYQVLHGYKFEDYDFVEAIDQADGRRMKVLREDLKKYKPKKTKLEDIMTVEAF
jgi:hypothetical protein